MLYFICYDIVNQKRLAKISKYLEKRGIRMQYSFFSCDIDEKDFKIIKNDLSRIIDEEKDKICFIPICESCIKKIIYIGCDESFILPDFVVL